MAIKAHITGLGTAPQTAAAIVGGVNTATAAAGTTQAGATLLPISGAVVITSGTGGVILPPGNGSGDKLSMGDTIAVANHTGSTITVYPPVGGAIANGTVNAGFAVPATKEATFRCIDSLNFTANLSV